MNMDQNDEFNTLLKTRDEPRAPAGLNAWIIAETQEMAQDKVIAGRWPWFDEVLSVWADLKYELFGGLVSPQPAFALALALFFGFSVGIYGESFNVLWGAVPGLTTDDLSGFMFIGDSFTAQEF
jgi:hypothetical protein